MISADTKIGCKLRNLRQRSNISLRQLAKESGVSVSYISSIEKDAVSPTLATLRKILVALGSSFFDFFNENDREYDQYFFWKSEMRTVTDSDRQYTFVLPRRDDISIELMDENYSPAENMPKFEVMEHDFSGYLISGSMTLEIDDAAPTKLSAGDAFFVPCGVKMRGYCEKNETAHLITVLIRGKNSEFHPKEI